MTINAIKYLLFKYAICLNYQFVIITLTYGDFILSIESGYPLMEIPFAHRYQCWFCGEPKDREISFPKEKSSNTLLTHPPLSIPCCNECATLIKRCAFESIFVYRYAVKKELAKKHQKTLSIGSRWTEVELQESQLEGSAFEGFKRSAWFMFKLQQARINFMGWPIYIDGKSLEVEDTQYGFAFDGTIYADLDGAINHVIDAFYLDELLFTRVLALLGKDKFAYAIRLCRLYPKLSTTTRESVFLEIVESLAIEET